MAIENDIPEIQSLDEIPQGVENLFIDREIERDNHAFKKARPALFLLSIFSSFLLLFSIYLVSPISKVKSISIVGTNYLKEKYIHTLSGISLDSYYYFVFPKVIENRLKKEPMIAFAKVELVPNYVIKITVQEKQPIGYRYSKDIPEILFSDDSRANLTSDYMPFLPRIPFIIGFETEEQTHLLSQGLAKLDVNMIESISEISQYDLGFDKQALQLQMRTGGYFFASYFSLEVLNNYNAIYSKMKDRNQCLFADGNKKVAYAKSCPWEEAPVTYDYWMNEAGEYIINQWGDKVIKKYYQDDQGNYFLDDTGNYILIPVDQYGVEHRDIQFFENYQAGYYKSGKLVLPE